MQRTNDDAVVIQKGKRPGDPYMVTVKLWFLVARCLLLVSEPKSEASEPWSSMGWKPYGTPMVSPIPCRFCNVKTSSTPPLPLLDYVVITSVDRDDLLEFKGKSWRHIAPNGTEPLGDAFVRSRGFFPEAKWYWIGIGVLFGFIILYNLCYTLALQFLNPIGNSQALIATDDDENETSSVQNTSQEPSNVATAAKTNK